VFFGSDYPIWCPEKELAKAKALGLPEDFLEDVLFRNFARFYHYRSL
jgi:predicted TIM-barrel fold metal-dependent hydrolase